MKKKWSTIIIVLFFLVLGFGAVRVILNYRFLAIPQHKASNAYINTNLSLIIEPDDVWLRWCHLLKTPRNQCGS